ncbi:hypothetical protein [Burkholderia phage FLC9]|nr:hypothetical protein [Burkholderia phage FLC9]
MKAFNWRSALALEEFPPPGGGTWSQTQAEIDAAKKRPTEDQDLEDTAKPTEQAGQIDGDTTTLSGQAKRGQNPVPDKEDTRGGGEPKINSAPVDLADVVLTEQDQRSYQPLVSDKASKDAINEQNLAQEGLVERIKDAFSGAEHGIMEVRVKAEENLATIESMKTKLQVRKGEVHEKAEPIRLSAFATWIALDGKIIDDEATLLKELGRLKEFADWITTDYSNALFAAYEHMATQVLKLGESDLDKATANFATVLEQFKPKNTEKFLTLKESTTEKGQTYTDMKSPMFLGSWHLNALEQPASNTAKGHTVSFSWHKDADKVKKGDFKPLPKAAMGKVLEVLNAISQVMASHKPDHKKYIRFLDALDEFAYRYRYFNELSREDKQKVTSIYSGVKIVAGADRLWFADRAVNHTVKAVLLYIEKSMRRIK